MKPVSGIFSRFTTTFRDKQEPENLKDLARVYWHTMLAIVFGLILLVLVYGAFVLFTVFMDKGDIGTQALGKPPAGSLSKERISEVLSGFEARQLRFEALTTDAKVIPDPSR